MRNNEMHFVDIQCTKIKIKINFMHNHEMKFSWYESIEMKFNVIIWVMHECMINDHIKQWTCNAFIWMKHNLDIQKTYIFHTNIAYSTQGQ